MARLQIQPEAFRSDLLDTDIPPASEETSKNLLGPITDNPRGGGPRLSWRRASPMLTACRDKSESPPRSGRGAAVGARAHCCEVLQDCPNAPYCEPEACRCTEYQQSEEDEAARTAYDIAPGQTSCN